MEVEARGSDILEGFKSQVRSSLGNWQRRAVRSEVGGGKGWFFFGP